MMEFPNMLEAANILMDWVVPPPRMPVANEGLGWDPVIFLVVTGILGGGTTQLMDVYGEGNFDEVWRFPTPLLTT